MQVEHPMSCFDHMNYLQNTNRDFGELLQIDNLILVFRNKYEFFVYNTESSTLSEKELLLDSDIRHENEIAFTIATHHKDLGKRSQHVESILKFSYYPPEAKNDRNSPEKLKSVQMRPSTLF